MARKVSTQRKKCSSQRRWDSSGNYAVSSNQRNRSASYGNSFVKAEDNIGIASISAFLSTDDGATWTELFHGKGASINYQFDTTAYTEEQVKIKAVAYDYAGNESEGLVHIYAIDNQGPSQIEGIQSVAVTAVTATLSWEDVPMRILAIFPFGMVSQKTKPTGKQFMFLQRLE